MIQPQLPFHFSIILFDPVSAFGPSDQIPPRSTIRIQTGKPKLQRVLTLVRPFDEQFLCGHFHGFSLKQSISHPDDHSSKTRTERSLGPLSPINLLPTLGRQVFGNLMKSSGRRKLSEDVSSLLGLPFEIMNIYFKKYAACRHIHPALDALKEIIDKNGIDIHSIEKIDAHTYLVAYRRTGRNREAKREFDAKFSLPLSLGLMCVYGKAGVEKYSMECLKNPLVQSITDKVTVAWTRRGMNSIQGRGVVAWMW